MKQQSDEAKRKWEEQGRRIQEGAGKGLQVSPRSAGGGAAPAAPATQYDPRARGARPEQLKQPAARAPVADKTPPARPACVYKAVMTDDEIDACR